MPVKILDSDQAFDNLKKNLLSRWPDRDGAGNRIEPLCKPGLRPSFQLSRQDKIFTIGSCFARHIEDALELRGFEVVTRAIGDHSRYILNNYSVPSMLNELQWALDPAQPFDESVHFFEVRPGRFVDAHLPNYIRPAPLEEVRAMRRRITEITSKVVECSTVIMTLGLVEVWFDTHSGRYLNLAPPKTMITRHPERFQLHVMDYDATLECIRRTISLLKQYCRSDQKVVLTVSPVPLLSTFDEDDVIIANCYSKSLLRTIANVIVSENSHIDYYPSYESVTLSKRELAWLDDQHHVTKELVQLNVGRMIAAYTAAEADRAVDIAPLMTKARESYKARDYRSALRELEPVAHLIDTPEDKLFYAELCAWSGRFDRAGELLAGLPAEVGGWHRQVLEARVVDALGNSERAVEILRAVLEGSPRRMHAYGPLIDILKREGDLDDAVDVLFGWSRVSLDPRVYMKLAEVFKMQGKSDSAREAYEVAVHQARSMVDDDKNNHIASRLFLDYAEFLREIGDTKRANEVLEFANPANQNDKARREKLKIFLG